MKLKWPILSTLLSGAGKSSRSTHAGPERGLPVSGGKVCPPHVGERTLEGAWKDVGLSQPQFWSVL
jgi:hypothetical protein